MKEENLYFTLLTYNQSAKSKSKPIRYKKSQVYPMLQWFYITVYMSSLLYLVWDGLLQTLIMLLMVIGESYDYDLKISPYCQKGTGFLVWGNYISIFFTMFWGYFLERQGTKNLLFISLCLLFFSFYALSLAFVKIDLNAESVNGNFCFLVFLGFFLEKLGRVLPELILAFVAINFKKWSLKGNPHFVPLIFSVSKFIIGWSDLIIPQLFYLQAFFFGNGGFKIIDGLPTLNGFWFNIFVYISTGICFGAVVMMFFFLKVVLMAIFSQFSEDTSRLVYNFDHSQFYKALKSSLELDFFLCFLGFGPKTKKAIAGVSINQKKCAKTGSGKEKQKENGRFSQFTLNNFEFFLLTITLGVCYVPFRHYHAILDQWGYCFWFSSELFCGKNVDINQDFGYFNLFYTFSLILPPLFAIKLSFSKHMRFMLFSNIFMGLFLNSLGVWLSMFWVQTPFQFYRGSHGLTDWPTEQIGISLLFIGLSSYYLSCVLITSWFRFLQLFHQSMGCSLGISLVFVGSSLISVMTEELMIEYFENLNESDQSMFWENMWVSGMAMLKWLFCLRLWIFQLRRNVKN